MFYFIHFFAFFFQTLASHIFNGCYAVLLLIVVIFFLIYGIQVYFKVSRSAPEYRANLDTMSPFPWNVFPLSRSEEASSPTRTPRISEPRRKRGTSSTSTRWVIDTSRSWPYLKKKKKNKLKAPKIRPLKSAVFILIISSLFIYILISILSCAFTLYCLLIIIMLSRVIWQEKILFVNNRKNRRKSKT